MPVSRRELLQLLGHGPFGEAALRCGLLQPAEEARHGNAIPPVRGAGSFLFGLVLFCLGQNAEIGGVDDFRLGQRQFDFCRSPIAVDLNGGFSKGLQCRFKFGRLF